MTYSGAQEARQARETLGKALEALQQHADIPDEVMGVAQNIAQSVGALFEAERASSEPDGRACTKNALGALSQTMALLQDVKTEHPGIQTATETIAEVMGLLYPITTKPSMAPPAPAAAATAAASSVAPPSRSVAPPAPAPAARADSWLPPEPPVPTGPRKDVEANIGATTQSNFYVGFTGEIADGGVFVATYEVLPKDTSVNLLVTLPGGYEFNVHAYVRFVRDPMDFSAESEPGMGIQFENLAADARELVLRFVRKRPPMFYDV